jgi:hypothetical protein
MQITIEAIINTAELAELNQELFDKLFGAVRYRGIEQKN